MVGLAGCGGGDEAGLKPPGGVRELENVLALRSDFEAGAGKMRVLLLFSPT